MWTLPGRSFRMPATDLRSILTTGRRPAGFVLMFLTEDVFF